MPSDIILQLFKSLGSFADLKALIQTSSHFNQVWLQNVSSITKALLPTTTDYLELAKDVLVVQDLHDQECRPGRGLRFRYVTNERNFWNRIFDFLVRQRDLIGAHCDVVDDTPTVDIIRHIDSIKERVERNLAKLDPKILAEEEAMTIKNKSVANMSLLQHAERLIAIEGEMRRYCGIFSDELRNYFRKGLPHHPIEPSDEETDRFMKAVYRDAVIEISDRLYDTTLAQAINAAIIVRLRPEEDDQLRNVRDWQLFIRFCDWEPHAVSAVRARKDELRWRPRRGKTWKSKTGCWFTEPFHFYTKMLLRSMVDAEWTPFLIGSDRSGDSGNGDLMEVDTNDDGTKKSDGKDRTENLDENDGTEDSDGNDSDYASCGLHSSRGSDDDEDEDEEMDEYLDEYMDEDDDNEDEDMDEEMEHVPHEGPCIGHFESIMLSFGYYNRHPRP